MPQVKTLRQLIKYKFYGDRAECAKSFGVSRTHLNQWLLAGKDPEVIESKCGNKFILVNKRTKVSKVPQEHEVTF